MATVFQLFRARMSRRVLLVISLLVCPLIAGANQEVAAGYPLRNQNPFLQVFGLPPFQAATLAADGIGNYDVSIDLANHADAGDNAVEDFVIDGESYFLTLSFRRGVSERLELGFDLPLVAHADGFMDNFVEGWHDAFGMSNTKRNGPSNQLRFFYANAGTTQYDLSSPSSGIGDIQLTAAMPLRKASDGDGLSVAVRSSLKLPTGDSDELRGSGAFDFSAGVYASDSRTLWERRLDYSGFAGALLLGDGDVLSSLQRSVVPYGGVAATWHMTDNLGVTTQLYVQGEYFDSDLDELGGNSVQLAVGGDYRLPKRGLSLSLALVEDVSANATTDFALHFSLRWIGDR